MDISVLCGRRASSRLTRLWLSLSIDPCFNPKVLQSPQIYYIWRKNRELLRTNPIAMVILSEVHEIPEMKGKKKYRSDDKTQE